jgi:hypothetical protein
MTSAHGSCSRDRCQVYGWIGGDRPSDVLEQAKERKEQGFTAVKMNAVESVNILCKFLLSFDNFLTSSDY